MNVNGNRGSYDRRLIQTSQAHSRTRIGRPLLQDATKPLSPFVLCPFLTVCAPNAGVEDVQVCRGGGALAESRGHPRVHDHRAQALGATAHLHAVPGEWVGNVKGSGEAGVLVNLQCREDYTQASPLVATSAWHAQVGSSHVCDRLLRESWLCVILLWARDAQMPVVGAGQAGHCSAVSSSSIAYASAAAHDQWGPDTVTALGWSL